jgi:hypothetical protein
VKELKMKRTFNIEIRHGLDNTYVGYEYAYHEVEVQAEGFDDAVRLAEQKYVAERPEMAKQIEMFGCSFSQQ